MDLPYIPEDIPLDANGRIDVSKEMEYIDILRNSGYDVQNMEELLITDIDHYKIRRASLVDVYNSMDAGGFGPGMEIDLSDEEQEEEDLLLYGGPILGDPDQDEGFDISLSSQEISGMDAKIIENDLLELSSEETIPSDEPNLSPEGELHGNNLNEPQENIIPEVEHYELKTGSLTSPKRGHRPFFIGLGAIVIITILIIGSYIYISSEDQGNGNDDPISGEFTISDMDPLIGDILNFSANDIGPQTTYEWKIIPDDHEIIEGDRSTPSIEVFFKKPGNYRIDLRVRNDLEDKTVHKFLDVSNREITIERERYGDRSLYDLSGNMKVQNVDDMIQKKNIYQFEELEIDFWTEKDNPMSVSISDTITTGKDGLGSEYHTMERETEQFMRFSGTISRRSGEYSSISGHSSLSQQNHIDLFNQRSFRTFSDTITHISIPVTPQYTIDYDMDESMMLYPSLKEQSNDLRIEDITEGRNLSVGDEGIAKWGKYDLVWNAVEMDIIMDRQCVRVDFEMDQSSKRELKLEEFEMIHWIAPDISSPVRTKLNITTTENIQHPSELYVLQDMVSFDSGADFVIYGSSEHRHDTVISAEVLYPSLETEFHDDWDMIPGLGSLPSSIPSNLGPVISLQVVLDSIDYGLWSSNKDDLLVVYSNFSNIGNEETWEFSIAEPDSEWGWNDTVTDGTTKGAHTKIRPVTISRNDLPAILTFSGAEYTLKNLLPDLDRDTTTRIFGKAIPSSSDDIRLSQNSITARVDHPYPRIGIVDPSLGGSIPYCLVIESFDGKIEVGLDMSNGQIAYILERSIN